MNYLDDFLNVAVLERPARKTGDPLARPTAETPETPAGALGHWWRPLLATRSQADRQAFGDAANALADLGVPFPEHEERAFVELWGRQSRMPAERPRPAGLDPCGWSRDGTTWTAPEARGTPFDPPSFEPARPRRERPDPEDGEAIRPYVGRPTKPAVVLESVDPMASARKLFGEWASVGREFIESAPPGRTPEHTACLYRLGAGMFVRAIREALDGGLDGELIAGLRLELADAVRLGSGA